MLSKSVVRIGFIGFIALMAMAWFAKPTSLNSELEAERIHLEVATLVSGPVVHSRNGDLYNASKEDVLRLRKYLTSHDFVLVSGSKAAMPGIDWFNRPGKTLPNRHYQHVWITDGAEPQVQFEPPLR